MTKVRTIRRASWLSCGDQAARARIALHTHARLRVEAARHGRSMEAEVRAILQERLTPGSAERGLGSRIRARFQGLEGDERASARYADIVTSREKIGRPVAVADAQIAAICRDLGATLATCNSPDFEDTGVELVNPWTLG